MSDSLPTFLRRSPEQNLRTAAWSMWTTIAGTAVAGAATFIWNLGWVWVIALTALAAICTTLYIALRIAKPLLPLRRWQLLTLSTDLIDYAEVNEISEYMPSPILEREEIRYLHVMGNGCGKWTRKVTSALAREKFGAIRKANGKIRFLASCPVNLATGGDEKQKAKAAKNAKSLVALRDLRDATQQSGGEFEIKTYKHLATLRLIIINNMKCIVGHYQEDGIGDSLDTPLLVFKCSDKNDWGFGHAFCRLFDSEWNRSSAPSSEEWAEIERLAAGVAGGTNAVH